MPDRGIWGSQRLGSVIPLKTLEPSFTRLNAEQATVAYTESPVPPPILLMHLVGGRMNVLLQSIGSGRSFEASLGELGIRAADSGIVDHGYDVVRYAIAARPSVPTSKSNLLGGTFTRASGCRSSTAAR